MFKFYRGLMNGTDNLIQASNEKEKLQELLVRAREGSQDALNSLKSRYAPLIVSQISKHSLDGMAAQDIVDIREEALIIFYNAVCNYDPSSGVEFGLYAKICIENGLITFVRSYFRRKKRSVLPLDRAEGVGDAPNFLQSIVDEENASELVRAIRDLLSDYENRVWWMYVSGMSVSDISANMGGVDPKSVSNAVYRIRKKLKSLMVERDNS